MKTLRKIVAVTLLTALLLIPFTSLASGTKTMYTTGKVNLRTGPGKNYSSITTVPEGTKFKFTDFEKDKRGIKWYFGSYKDEVGWVSSVYLSKEKPAEDTVVKATGDTYIRDDANKNAEILDMLPEGKTATYLDRTRTDRRGVDWYRVNYKGVKGWVSSKYTYIR